MGLFNILALFGAASAGWEQGSRNQKKRNPSWAGMNDMFADSHSPEFIDYRDKWGSNNDHNWEADGDMQWDDYE